LYASLGAQEFFRVNETSHIIRLIQHVCRYIDADGVLSDLLVLCEAFSTSVSKVDACVFLAQRIMVAKPRMLEGQELSRADHVATIVGELYSKDCELADRVGERMIAFCTETIEDARRLIIKDATFCAYAKQRAIIASSTACSVLSTMRNNATRGTARIDVSRTLKEFQRMSKLQTGCDVFVSLTEMRDPSSCVSVIVELLRPCIKLLKQKSFKFEDGSLKEKLQPIIASAKHWCAILCDSPSSVSNLWLRSVGMAASIVAKTAENHASLLLLQVSGVLDEIMGHSSYHSVLSVALTLIGRAAVESSILSKSISSMTTDEENLSQSLLAMKSIAQASLLLREHIILFSPPSMLPPSISLTNLSEFVCDVSCRSDLGIGEKLERYIRLLQTGSRKHRHQLKRSSKILSDKKNLPTSPILHPSWYIGDGLLLRPFETLVLSMAACKSILEFDNISTEVCHATNSPTRASDIIYMLESRGAHSTCLRLASFSDSVALSRNASLLFSNRIESISAALAERSLGGIESGLTSGAVDHHLSISLLIGNLPKEKAFTVSTCSFLSVCRDLK
jgi:hypothetical protein